MMYPLYVAKTFGGSNSKTVTFMADYIGDKSTFGSRGDKKGLNFNHPGGFHSSFKSKLPDLHSIVPPRFLFSKFVEDVLDDAFNTDDLGDFAKPVGAMLVSFMENVSLPLAAKKLKKKRKRGEEDDDDDDDEIDVEGMQFGSPATRNRSQKKNNIIRNLTSYVNSDDEDWATKIRLLNPVIELGAVKKITFDNKLIEAFAEGVNEESSEDILKLMEAIGLKDEDLKVVPPTNKSKFRWCCCQCCKSGKPFYYPRYVESRTHACG